MDVVDGVPPQVRAVQVLGVLATVVWSALASYLIVMGVQASVGLRVSEDDEVKGLDITTHGESGYRL